MGCEQSKDSFGSNQILPIFRKDEKLKKFKAIVNDSDQIPENIIKKDQKLCQQDIQTLEKILTKHYFFYKLTKQQKNHLIENIQIYTANSETILFKHGDPASMFFSIRKGEVKVQIQAQQKVQSTILKKGDCFGELALLYKAPRSATIMTLDDCEFFCLSHRVFRRAMQEVTIKNYENVKEHVKNSKIFNYLTTREKNAISYNSHELKFHKGEIIFKEGDDANSFFIVMKGKILIQIPGKPDIIMTEGHSFGENSFQRGQIRNGTAKAEEKSTVLSIGREALKKCIGNALDELSCYNIMKWAIRRHPVLKKLSDLQREKIISVAQISRISNKSRILQKGSICDSFIICLEEKIDDDEVGAIINLDYIFQKQDNERRVLKTIYKNGSGKVAFFSFSSVNKALGKHLSKCLDQKPLKSLKQLEQNKKRYINGLKLESLKVKYGLGEGMFGKVLCVEDECNKFYALKCIEKQKILQEEMEDFIINEKKYLEETTSDFIVTLYRTLFDENYIYFLMKYINGGDFFQILRSVNVFAKPKAQFYFGCLINAISDLHMNNIIYRDIKPENAVVDREGYLYLIDLGTAKRLTEDKGFRTFTIIGTPHYMAPETIQGQGYSFPADLWSLGVFFYEVLCGRLPFGNTCEDPYEIFKEIQNTPISFPSTYSDHSGIILMEKLLSKDERDRQIEDFSKIKNMSYFEDFDWESLENRTMDTPYTINRESLNKIIDKPLMEYIKQFPSSIKNGQRSQSQNETWNSIFQFPREQTKEEPE